MATPKSSALKKKGIFKVGPSMFIHKDGKTDDLHEHWRGGKQTFSRAKKIAVKDSYGGNVRWHLNKSEKGFKGVSHGTND